MLYLCPFGSYIDGVKALSEKELEDYLFPICDKDNDSVEKKFGRMTYMYSTWRKTGQNSGKRL